MNRGRSRGTMIYPSVIVVKLLALGAAALFLAGSDFQLRRYGVRRATKKVPDDIITPHWQTALALGSLITPNSTSVGCSQSAFEMYNIFRLTLIKSPIQVKDHP
jgi:hypothetical protein